MTYSESDKFEKICTQKPGVDGVGLWQWIVVNSIDGTYTRTQKTICRYGELYTVKPKCPWNACNGDCSVCNDDWAANGTAEEFLQ